MREALRSNPELTQGEMSLEAARARKHSAFGGFLPRVSGSFSLSDSNTDEYAYFRDFDPGYSFRFSASQPIFTGFSTLADYRRASASAESEAAALVQEEADLRERLRKAFISVMYGQVNVRVQEEIAGRRRDNSELVRLMYETGRENKGTALRAEADAAQSNFAAAQARRSLILARQRLAREMGRDEVGETTVEEEWEVVSLPEDVEIRELAERTPAVIRARASLKMAKAQSLGSHSSFLPNVNANASITPGWMPDENRRWSAGVSVSYSIFNGGRRWFNALAARAGTRRAREGLVAARRNAGISLQAALFEFLDGREEMEVRALYLEASRQRAEIGRAQYTNGLMDFVKWDLIENELVQAERRFIAAQRTALDAEAGWVRAKGEGFEK